MLKESDQNIIMEQEKKHRLIFHRSNLFHPTPFGISKLAIQRDSCSIAAVKEPVLLREASHHVSYVEVYRTHPSGVPKFSLSFVIYEHLKGIVWVNFSLLLTVSTEQTISLYETKCQEKIYSIMTDYGPITCLKYLHDEKLLFIGTEYGYVAVYKVHLEDKKVEFLTKMVKINNRIQSIEVATKSRIVKKSKSKAKGPARVNSPNKTSIKPGKRKKPESSSDESEDESAGDSADSDPLSKIDISIYGASLGDVVVWNFHSKTIIDTMRVCDKPGQVVSSLLALNNGDLVAGDSTGTISVFDHNSLTCRQTIKTSDFGISCIAKNDDGSHILASGIDPTIVILKRGAVDKADLVLYERTQSHTHEVSSIIFRDKREFYTGSIDGLIIRHKLYKKVGIRKEMRRHVILPNYHNHINFSHNEMLIQQDRTLVLFKLPETVLSTPADLQLVIDSQPLPIKHLLLKTRDFVHSSTFSDKWIAYSTRKGLYIFNREAGKLEAGKPDKQVRDCSILRICSNRYLVCGAGISLYCIDLEDVEETSEKGRKCIRYKVRSEVSLKAVIDQIIYIQSLSQVLVICRYPTSKIYSYKLKAKKKKVFKEAAAIVISGDEISCVGYNNPLAKIGKILVFTCKSRLITLDFNDKRKVLNLTNEISMPVTDLPGDASIIGMLPLSKEVCLLYNENHLFKVDLVSNKVINTNTDYNNIVKMDFLFNKANQVALAELRPDDYMKSLPPVVQLKKFGCK